MRLIKAENISIEVDGNLLFENVSLEIQEGERVALIGRNGVGKTTLIKSLLGQFPVSKGLITNQTTKEEWGWVDQGSNEEEHMLVREFVERENSQLYQLKRKLKEAEILLESGRQEESLLTSYTNDLESYAEQNGYEWENTVERHLLQMDISKELWDIPFQNLSGGQKTKVKLAKAMIKKPKFLILDEPTNHLDAETMQWLANWLLQFKGAILFISHDRAFIDKVAHTTYELTNKGTKKYNGGYSIYQMQKEHQQKTDAALYQKQEKERKKLVEAIAAYKQWFQQAHNAAGERNPFGKKKANKHATRGKAKEKALERLENTRIAKPQEGPKLHANLEGESFLSKKMLTLENVAFSYIPPHHILKEVSFSIERGERLAIVGKNGTGKTTLLNLLTGDLLPTNGRVIRHPQLKIGYFMQELEGLDPDENILNHILSLPNMTQTEARTILACFLFRKEDVFKKIKDLSMGEKCRVAFVKLYFSHANLLVLDEPTNYLDIETREKIEEALSLYPGAVVIVSHDSYLLEKVANRVISLENGQVHYYPGIYADWKEYKHIPHDLLAIHNEKHCLELQMTQLLTEEQESETYWEQIRSIKDKIEALTAMERNLN